jgi:hypothetical protein
MELSLKQPLQMALPIQACQPIAHLDGSKHINPFPSGWSFAAHILVLLKILDVMNNTCRGYGLQELTSF